jgi:hypothetical protein
VAVFGAGVAAFDDLAYGAPLASGYRPGEVVFSLGAVLPNFRYMPGRLIRDMPMLVLGLAALVWIIMRWVRLRRAGGGAAATARRDFGVGLALAASWFSVWGLYAAYTWTAVPGQAWSAVLQTTRFYVPAMGAISLLGAWLLVRVPPRATLAALASAVVVAGAFGLGVWSYASMRAAREHIVYRHGPPPRLHPPGSPGSMRGADRPHRRVAVRGGGHQGRLVLVSSTAVPGHSSRPTVIADVSSHGDSADTAWPHRRATTLAAAKAAAAASASPDPPGAGSRGSGSSAHASAVNAVTGTG